MKQQSLDLIRAASAYVDAFLPVSRYYLDYMPGYLGIPREKMRLVPLGINYGRLLASPAPAGRSRSRSATSRGLRRRRACTCSPMRIAVCVRGRASASPGSWPPAISRPSIRPTSTGITSDLNNWGLQGQFEYRGEVDRAQKIDFLRSLDVLSVPATYEEPKGIFLLEAMANGVPVVQPRRGAFPEIVETTGGGLLVEADNPEALADGFQALWRDPARAAALGAAGAAGVREHYSVDGMAESAEGVYREVIGSRGSASTRGPRAQR